MVLGFRKFIYADDTLYDGIAIDVGGPGFQFDDESMSKPAMPSAHGWRRAAASS